MYYYHLRCWNRIRPIPLSFIPSFSVRSYWLYLALNYGSLWQLFQGCMLSHSHVTRPCALLSQCDIKIDLAFDSPDVRGVVAMLWPQLCHLPLYCCTIMTESHVLTDSSWRSHREAKIIKRPICLSLSDIQRPLSLPIIRQLFSSKVIWLCISKGYQSYTQCFTCISQPELTNALHTFPADETVLFCLELKYTKKFLKSK